jgi:hypothetical protein
MASWGQSSGSGRVDGCREHYQRQRRGDCRTEPRTARTVQRSPRPRVRGIGAVQWQELARGARRGPSIRLIIEYPGREIP